MCAFVCACAVDVQPHISHWVMVDCNVISDTIASKYPDWLDAGIHILSCNLSGASGSKALYSCIQVRFGGAAFVTVCNPTKRSAK